MRLALCAAIALAPRIALAQSHDGPRAFVVDDGERIARDVDRALPPGPWPRGDVELFAMRGETIAVQVVVETGEREAAGVHAVIGSLAADDGTSLAPDIDMFTERFVEIARASGNDRAPGSLAFTAKAAPSASIGWMADALVPTEVTGDLRVAPRSRGAIWIDVRVPDDARAGEYRGAILVRDDDGEIAARPLSLRVLDRALPYAAAKTMVYYDTAELARRMGADSGANAERDLRKMLHAHHLSAIHEVTSLDALDIDALTGEAFTPAHGYRGAGEGIGEGVLAIGAYGALGEPSAHGIDVAERIARAMRARGAFGATQTFLYAVDEECESPWGAMWRARAARSDALRGVRVGVTCGRDPMAQAADLVMQTAEDLVPARARIARDSAAKWVWAYNGRRPFAGPMMLDVPAVDLRANAWIAARYGIERWFYWESTFWFDGNRGGRGGESGFDPYVVAETFHNADGDWANGDGILVYPGTQRAGAPRIDGHAEARVDYGVATVFPSVRLKNLRRGIEDAGYIALARAVDRAAADAIVRKVVPRALALADARASWPERGAAWLEARRDLAQIIDAPRARPGRAADDEGPADVRATVAMSDGCSVKSRARGDGETSAPLQIALLLIVAFARRVRRIGTANEGS